MYFEIFIYESLAPATGNISNLLSFNCNYTISLKDINTAKCDNLMKTREMKNANLQYQLVEFAIKIHLKT